MSNFTKITSYTWNFLNFTCVLTILVKFDIHFLGIPWAILKASIITNATCIGFCSLMILFCFEFMLWLRKHKRIGREIISEIFSFKNPLVYSCLSFQQLRVRTTTINCRVSFIDLYLVFPRNFRMVFLPHTNTVILLDPYCGTMIEPGLPVVIVAQNNGTKMYKKKCAARAKLFFCQLDLLLFFTVLRRCLRRLALHDFLFCLNKL